MKRTLAAAGAATLLLASGLGHAQGIGIKPSAGSPSRALQGTVPFQDLLRWNDYTPHVGVWYIMVENRRYPSQGDATMSGGLIINPEPIAVEIAAPPAAGHRSFDASTSTAAPNPAADPCAQPHKFPVRVTVVSFGRQDYEGSRSNGSSGITASVDLWNKSGFHSLPPQPTPPQAPIPFLYVGNTATIDFDTALSEGKYRLNFYTDSRYDRLSVSWVLEVKCVRTPVARRPAAPTFGPVKPGAPGNIAPVPIPKPAGAQVPGSAAAPKSGTGAR